MLVYEFIYTGIGQFVAAPAPNAIFAALINPLLIGTLVSFCGVLVPYSQIQPFWKYWVRDLSLSPTATFMTIPLTLPLSSTTSIHLTTSWVRF
jgi:ABC-type multidrug transport system permease subunit